MLRNMVKVAILGPPDYADTDSVCRYAARIPTEAVLLIDKDTSIGAALWKRDLDHGVVACTNGPARIVEQADVIVIYWDGSCLDTRRVIAHAVAHAVLARKKVAVHHREGVVTFENGELSAILEEGSKAARQDSLWLLERLCLRS